MRYSVAVIAAAATATMMLVGSALAATAASDFIYWANANTPNVGRANLDGTSPNQSFITGATTPWGVTLTPPPPPPPPVETTQTAAGGCVTSGSTPKSIPRRGRKQLMKPGCKTNAGKTIGVRVSAALRGDARYYRLYCKVSNTKERAISKNSSGAYCKTGALYIRTYGYKLRLRITWAAPATGTYKAYKKVKTYTT